jgi:hypothetical protein
LSDLKASTAARNCCTKSCANVSGCGHDESKARGASGCGQAATMAAASAAVAEDIDSK